MTVQEGIGYLRATTNPDLHFTENSDAYANLMYPYIQDDGGNIRNVSLSIDIINHGKITNKNRFKNQRWSIPETNNGNLLLDELIWGFKESTHNTRDSKALSNAFCFNKQQLTVKINKQGHLQGFIGEDYLYSKNSIEVSVVDVVRGNESVLYAFEDLESDIDNEDRAFQWTVPSEEQNAFSDYGFFGLFVLKIKVTSKYYIDARREVRSNYSDRTTNSYLQLLTFSAAKEADNVSPDKYDIFVVDPHTSNSFNELYDRSIFSTLDDTNQNALTADQKRAIMADQIAVLFMSQHQVVSSDLTPSKIQGYGGEQALQPHKVLRKAITYAERYDRSVIQLAQNRLFGIFANYKTFSFANEINNLFSSTDQSQQSIVDPPRIINIDSSGTLVDNIGVDGILFNPYAIENKHTEIMSNVPFADPYSISLFKYSVGIDTLSVTNFIGEELECGDTNVKTSFNIVFGEENISEVYYQVWIKNGNGYTEYLDKSGKSRSHKFDLSDYGGITCTYSGSTLTKGDILSIRVTVTDIFGFSNVFNKKLFFPLGNEFPAITEISSYQRQDGSGLIDVFYHYQGTSEVDPANVSLSYSTDNTSFSSISTNVIGDIGIGVMPGYRKITWNPSSTLTESNDVAFFKIALTSVDSLSNAGITESSVVVVDLSTPIVDIRRLSITEDEEMEESSSISESSDSSYSSYSSSSSSSSIDSSSSSSKGYSSSSSESSSSSN